MLRGQIIQGIWLIKSIRADRASFFWGDDLRLRVRDNDGARMREDHNASYMVILMPLQQSTKSLISNLFAYGASEVASKASRLLVVMAVARTLDLTEIGIAAAALAAGDILKALTENGVGQRIIAAKKEDLEATCATAHRLFWMLCIGLFTAQAGIAGIVYLTSESALIATLILIMGLEYLFMPAGIVQVALAMRAGMMRQTAAIGGAQMVGANLISIGLLFVWPSAIALILPRVLAAPIWLIAVRRLHPWTRDPNITPAPVMPFVRYGGAVVGVEVVKAMRLQADKLVVGMTLGADMLGLYFMAFNAGLSLSNAFSTAFSTVLFPHLSQTADRVAALRQSLLTGVGIIGPLVIAQALFAPVYVPLMLGDGWDETAHLVSILCLVAIPTTVWATASGWLRTQGRPDIELSVTILSAIGVIVNAFLIGPMGLTALTIGYAVTTTTVMGIAAACVLRTALKRTEPEMVAT
jgi:PST family polysaccharide transporter